MAKGSNSITKTAVWILLGLLILGLGGFGATSLSGNIRTIGSVGDKPVSVDLYGRQLQQEIAAISAQTGQSLSFAQVQDMGLDRAVLQRVVQQRALDHEAATFGLSIGDENLRDRILEIPAFRGVDGSFDREGYRFMLEQNGLSEAAFETSLREETARTLLQSAVLGAVEMPRSYVDTLIKFVAQERSFTWTRLDRSSLTEPLPTASEEDLRAYYEANIAAFTLPETKQLTYAMLSPDMLLDEVEIDEDALREAYEQRRDEFNQPERRLVERLVFADTAAAEQAAAGLEVGNAFETLVQDRGLSLSDIDLGDVAEDDLGDAGAEVFAAEPGTVVGPLPSALGPALFRVNAVLPALQTSFDEARAQLQEDLARDRAVRVVEAQAQSLDDMLAGGATLEELDRDTDMVLGQIDWTPDATDGIAAYEAFRNAAAAASAEDFPQIDYLDDGGLFAFRIDAVLPPRPADFDDVRDAVNAAYSAAAAEAALSVEAEALVPLLSEGAGFAELELDAIVEQGLTRNAFVDQTPAGFMEAVFEMAVGEVRVVSGDGAVVLVRLDAIADADDSPEAAALAVQIAQQINQSLAQNIFAIYAADVVQRADPQIDPRAVQAVHVNFP